MRNWSLRHETTSLVLVTIAMAVAVLAAYVFLAAYVGLEKIAVVLFIVILAASLAPHRAGTGRAGR